MQTPVRSAHTKTDRLLATRLSLIERLADWKDQARWQQFYDTYWRLIYGVARQSGLTDAEAQDVVQETVITVAKNITKYERAAGACYAATAFTFLFAPYYHPAMKAVAPVRAALAGESYQPELFEIAAAE